MSGMRKWGELSLVGINTLYNMCIRFIFSCFTSQVEAGSKALGQGENKYFKTRGTGELKKISNGKSVNLGGGLSFVG